MRKTTSVVVKVFGHAKIWCLFNSEIYVIEWEPWKWYATTLEKPNVFLMGMPNTQIQNNEYTTTKIEKPRQLMKISWTRRQILIDRHVYCHLPPSNEAHEIVYDYEVCITGSRKIIRQYSHFHILPLSVKDTPHSKMILKKLCEDNLWKHKKNHLSCILWTWKITHMCEPWSSQRETAAVQKLFVCTRNSRIHKYP